MTKQLWYVFLSIQLVVGLTAFAARAESTAADEMESLFEKDDQSANTTAPKTDSTTAAPEAKKTDAKDLQDVQKLSDFKDVAVIQKRFLPKTGRYELFGAGTMVLNDPFFQSFGVNARAAYYFSERYGIEFNGIYVTTIQRAVTGELQSRGVITQVLVTPRAYFGLDFKWSPIYGKMTWLNKRITPFDLYFSAGLGETQTNQGGTDPTLHLGTGQTFALDKSHAFRWDFSWNIYNAQSSVSQSSGTALYTNLMLTVGYSWFFPEATYR